MGCRQSRIWVLLGIIFGMLLRFECTISSTSAQQKQRNIFPAMFVFGDSLVDAGNNNYILSLARANNKPFGIDFPYGATGRFTNGMTVVDVICGLLNLPLIPAYLDPRTRGPAILKGVNYASGAGGILPDTGANYIGRIDFDKQIQWFGNTLVQLQQLLGSEVQAQYLLSNSLIILVLGSNDYINNYLLPFAKTQKLYTPQQFQDILLRKYHSQLAALYSMGARNFVVASVGPLGCIPSQLAASPNSNGQCVQYINDMVFRFNAGLQQAIQLLNAENPGAKYVYADTYSPILSYAQSPLSYGFQVGNQACCGFGKFKGQVPCLPIILPCINRNAYVFWDPFHPTQHANILLGNTLYNQLKPYFI